jgi:phosphopantetheine adenylyltransferase
MAKVKTKKKDQPVAVVKDATGQTVAEIAPKYKMLPVDFETYQGVLRLCEARGLNKRSQGVVVKSLVTAALRELPPNL